MIKSLVALLAALTVGTFLLLALETRPARPNRAIALSMGKQATSNSAVFTEVMSATIPPLQGRWLNIIIHDSICDMNGDPTADCHFIIYGPDSDGLDGQLRATGRWRKQARGAHIAVPGHDFNAVSIGICLEGDLADHRPSPRQLESLADLTRALQRKLGIRSERIYLHTDLAATQCPGNAFPVGQFRSVLLTATR